MATKVIVKKKKSVILKPKSIKTESTPASGKTLHLDDPDDEVMDASQSTVVELNSSTLRDPIPQKKLEPEEAEPTPEDIPPQEEMFKFFCYRCGQKLKVPMSWANMSIRCGRCDHDLVIPPPLMTLPE